MKKHIAILAALSLLYSPAAQAEDTLESVANRIVNRLEDDRFITLSVENDLFGGGTDQNYTSGVRLTYFKLGSPPPDIAKFIDAAVPTFKIKPATSVYYSIGQNLYTPKNISSPLQDPLDRPWAAFLYASAGLSTITTNHVDEVELALGVVGPAALGKETQKFIHKIVNSPDPKGWHNQLENEPGIILSWDRRYPARFETDVWKLGFSAEPHFGVTLGNIYTYAQGGISFRANPIAGRWQDDPIRVRPSIPGTGAFVVPSGVFAWHLFGGIEGRAVARNIFLDGNTFENSHSVDKETFVMDATAGLALTYGKARISYALVYRSKEFETQQDPSVFGTMSVGFRF